MVKQTNHSFPALDNVKAFQKPFCEVSDKDQGLPTGLETS